MVPAKAEWIILEPGTILLNGTSITIRHSPECASPYEVFWGEKSIFDGLAPCLSQAKSFVIDDLIPRLIEMGQEP